MAEKAPYLTVPAGGLCLNTHRNKRLKMDGMDFLRGLMDGMVACAFFDPQYRGLLDRMKYGNADTGLGSRRLEFRQMGSDTINGFVLEIDRVLQPSGHLFLWLDKFHLCEGFREWLDGSGFELVDMLVWVKNRLGMGYRTRRVTEFLLVLQKRPKRARGVWTDRGIPDALQEGVDNRGAGSHIHAKPARMQARLIECVTKPGDLVIDPAAGSFSVMHAAHAVGRNFMGCDLNG